jgi:hypothetical protein
VRCVGGIAWAVLASVLTGSVVVWQAWPRGSVTEEPQHADDRTTQAAHTGNCVRGRPPRRGLCATVSVVEAVREDRFQALMPAPRYDSLCNWHPWVAFRSELSAVVPASAWPTPLA